MLMTDWVIGLDAGGLPRAGFPVPDGFCVTTAADQQVAPDEIEHAIREAYLRLGTDVTVAVLSSATQLEAVGADAVLDAVRQASVDQETVVVQRMIDAKAAGTLCTANPATGRRHEAVIDATPGSSRVR
jgi:phosphoenolpyruvate synthase/pyruvate phosphate dikinase